MKYTVYLKALITLIIYSISSKTIFAVSIQKNNLFNSIIPPMLFGAVFSIIFLYLFSHEDFFKLAKEIERREKKKENYWLHKFKHSGKIITTVLIGIIAGPILSALTARILLKNYKYKYLLVCLISVPSTIFTVGLAKGVISIF